MFEAKGGGALRTPVVLAGCCVLIWLGLSALAGCDCRGDNGPEAGVGADRPHPDAAAASDGSNDDGWLPDGEPPDRARTDVVTTDGAIADAVAGLDGARHDSGAADAAVGDGSAGDAVVDACASDWQDLTACGCTPDQCNGCAGEKSQADGCGHQRTVACARPATGCAAPATCRGSGGPLVCGVDPSPVEPYSIAVIMLDDLDVGSFEALLAAGWLPGIRRYLLDYGSRFAEAFVTNSSCCPSRASFFTGQYCHNHSVKSVYGTQGGYAAFRGSGVEATALPVVLKAAGYRTGFMGKYLNGYGNGVDPFGSGWNAQSEARVPCPGCPVPPGWDEWYGMQLGGEHGAYAVAPYTGCANHQHSHTRIEQVDGAATEVVGSPQYHTDLLAQQATGFIDRAAGQPFFLYVAPIATHTETFVRGGAELCGVDVNLSKSHYLAANGIRPAARHAGALAGRFSLPQGAQFNDVGTGRPYWFGDGADWWNVALSSADVAALERLYVERLEAMLAVDDLVGAIGAKLVETGLFDRTLLILVSDNGYELGEHRLVNKMFPYEESIRVPLLIRSPGASAPTVVAGTALMQDLAPTILDFATGVDANAMPVDGRSLRPLLAGGSPPWRHQFLIEHWYGRETGPLRFWEVPDYVAVRTAAGGALTSNQLYVEYYDDAQGAVRAWMTGWEHFAMNSDPDQMTSRSGSEPMDRPRMHLSSVLNLLAGCQQGVCRQAENLPPPGAADPCQTVAAVDVQVRYDVNGNPAGLRQHVYSGGLVWMRDGGLDDAWPTTWSVAGLAHAWGQIGTTPAPGQDPLSHPSVEGADATAVRWLSDGVGNRTGVRQILYRGSRYWWRDSQDVNGEQWGAAWQTGTLSEPWVPGRLSVEIRPRYGSGLALVGFRQQFVDADTDTVYYRDSLDVAGVDWPATWATQAAPFSGVDALSIHPVFDGAGRQIKMRQLFFTGSTLHWRDSSDPEGNSWPANWSASTLQSHWGAHANHPPTTADCH